MVSCCLNDKILMSKIIELKDNENEKYYPYGITKSFILYDNPNGATGSVSLNDSVDNYEYIDICYENPTFNLHNTTRIYNPQNKQTSLTVAMRYIDNGAYYTYFRDIEISNSLISNAYCGYYAVRTDGSIEYFNDNNYIRITKVIGYK